MAVAIPPGTTLLPDNILYALCILCGLSYFLLFFMITFIKGKVPEAASLIKAELFKRPWIHVHTSLNQLIMYAPKRSGKDKDDNTWDMEKFLGVKIVPDPEMVEYTQNGRAVSHYYSKSAPAITAKEAAACRDVIEHLKHRGIAPTDVIVDALFIANDEELEEWYGESDPEMLRTIYELKNELNNKFIHDGQFVYEVVKDFIFAASNETSRSLDEFKSIAHEQADERFRNVSSGKNDKQTLMFGVIFLFALAIAYKIAFAT